MAEELEVHYVALIIYADMFAEREKQRLTITGFWGLLVNYMSGSVSEARLWNNMGYAPSMPEDLQFFRATF